jgi:hypothetical protein
MNKQLKKGPFKILVNPETGTMDNIEKQKFF